MSVNPLNQLYKDLLLIIKKSIIKYKSRADYYESLDIKKIADIYLAAMKNEDSFNSYTYDKDTIFKTIMSLDNIINHLNKAESISELKNIENIKFKPIDNTTDMLKEKYTGFVYNRDDLSHIVVNPDYVNYIENLIEDTPKYPFYVKDKYIYPYYYKIDYLSKIDTSIDSLVNKIYEYPSFSLLKKTKEYLYNKTKLLEDYMYMRDIVLDMYTNLSRMNPDDMFSDENENNNVNFKYNISLLNDKLVSIEGLYDIKDTLNSNIINNLKSLNDSLLQYVNEYHLTNIKITLDEMKIIIANIARKTYTNLRDRNMNLLYKYPEVDVYDTIQIITSKDYYGNTISRFDRGFDDWVIKEKTNDYIRVSSDNYFKSTGKTKDIYLTNNTNNFIILKMRNSDIDDESSRTLRNMNSFIVKYDSYIKSVWELLDTEYYIKKGYTGRPHAAENKEIVLEGTLNFIFYDNSYLYNPNPSNDKHDYGFINILNDEYEYVSELYNEKKPLEEDIIRLRKLDYNMMLNGLSFNYIGEVDSYDRLLSLEPIWNPLTLSIYSKDSNYMYKKDGSNYSVYSLNGNIAVDSYNNPITVYPYEVDDYVPISEIVDIFKTNHFILTVSGSQYIFTPSDIIFRYIPDDYNVNSSVYNISKIVFDTTDKVVSNESIKVATDITLYNDNEIIYTTDMIADDYNFYFTKTYMEYDVYKVNDTYYVYLNNLGWTEIDEYSVFNTNYSDFKGKYIDGAQAIIDKVNTYYDDIISMGSSIDDKFKKTLFNVKHNEIINNYVEYNNYYRALQGLPNLKLKTISGEIQYDGYGHPILYRNEDGEVEIEDVVRLDKTTAIKYGIIESSEEEAPYIHDLEKSTISLLYEIKHPNDINNEYDNYIDYLIANYPDYDYLKYLGDNAIDTFTSRLSKSFGLLSMPYNINENTWNIFSTIYEQCREYFMSVIYIPEYKGIMDHYDNFIAMSIMIMTIQQILSRIIKSGIERDFYDDNAIRILFDAYKMPYNENMSPDIRKTLVQNLNILIQNKGTNKVIYDILDVLGFSNVAVNEYYLMKQRKEYTDDDKYIFSEDGKIQHVIIDTEGHKTYQDINSAKDMFRDNASINDVKNTYNDIYNIHFQEVNIKTDNLYNELTDKNNYVAYNVLTESDPYWIEDSDLLTELYDTEYNYIETKYLGLTISYKMTKILFENIYLFKMILDNKESLKNITISLPKISISYSISLFDAIIALCAIVCKQNNLKGNVITDYSKTLHVMGFNFYDDLNTIRSLIKYDEETMSKPEAVVNKNMLDIENATNSISYNKDKKYMSYNNINDKPFFNTYTNKSNKTKYKYNEDSFSYWIDLLDLHTDKATMINKINEIYNGLYGGIDNKDSIGSFYKFLIDTMSTTDDIKIYRACKIMYKSIFYTKENREIYKMGKNSLGEDEYAKTYMDYLYKMNPSLYSIIENTDESYLYQLIDNIVDEISNTYFNNMKYLGFYSKSSDSFATMLIELIRFFKSYTVDMINLKTLYVFDFKGELLLRLIDKVCSIEKDFNIEENSRLSYSDIIHLINKKISNMDKLVFKNKYFIEGLSILKDKYENSSLLNDIVNVIDGKFIIDDNTTYYDNIHFINITDNKLNDNINLNDKIQITRYNT